MATNYNAIYNNLQPRITTLINNEIDDRNFGEVSSITAGTGISLSPNPIVTTGSVSLDASISDLNNVTINSPINTQILSYNGTSWVNQTFPGLSGASIRITDLIDVDVSFTANNLLAINSAGTSVVNITNNYLNNVSGGYGIDTIVASPTAIVDIATDKLDIVTDIEVSDYIVFHSLSEIRAQRQRIDTINLSLFNNDQNFLPRAQVKAGTAITVTDDGTCIIIGVSTSQVPINFDAGVSGILTIENGGTSSGTSAGARENLGLVYNSDILPVSGPSFRGEMYGNHITLLPNSFGLSLITGGTGYTDGTSIILINPDNANLINTGIGMSVTGGVILGPSNTGLSITDINLKDIGTSYQVYDTSGSGAYYEVTPEPFYLLFGDDGVGLRNNLGNLQVKSSPTGEGASWRQIFPLNMDGLCDVVISGVSDNDILIYDGDKFVNTGIKGNSNFGVSFIKSGTSTIVAIEALSGINASAIANGSVSNTEFVYLDGVTSNIQTQLDGKLGTSPNGQTPSLGDMVYNNGTCWALVQMPLDNEPYILGVSTANPREPHFGYLYNFLEPGTCFVWSNDQVAFVKNGTSPGYRMDLASILEDNLCGTSGGLTIPSVSKNLILELDNLNQGTVFPTPSTDSIAFYNSATTITQKMTVNDFVSNLAGDNLSASAGKINFSGVSPVNLPRANSGLSLQTNFPPATWPNSLAGVSHSTVASGSSLVYSDGTSWYYVTLGDYVY